MVGRYALPLPQVSAVNRRTHIDVLRVAAIFMVLYNHSGERGFLRFAVTDGAASWVYLFIAVLDKLAVPLFLMISGALLLGRDEPIGVVLKKRVLKYVLTLIGASAVMYVYEHRGQPLSAGEFFTTLYSGEHAVAYWYLYAYVAFLLVLPFMRRLARAMTMRDFAYATALMGLMSLVSAGELFAFDGHAALNDNFSLFVTKQIIYYPLAGYFLEHRLEPLSGKRLAALSILGAAAVGVSCVLLRACHAISGEWLDRYFTILIYLPALAAYAGVKAALTHRPLGTRMQRAVTALASCTFGVYLFEKVYRSVSSRVFHVLEPFIGTYPACLVWIACAVLLGCCVTAVWRAGVFRVKSFFARS